jgi:hypothetical protein
MDLLKNDRKKRKEKKRGMCEIPTILKSFKLP